MKTVMICFSCILTALLLLSGPVMGEPLSDDLSSPVFAPAGGSSFSLLQEPDHSTDSKHSIRPNSSLSRRGDLGTFCYSPVDTVTHYVGATFGDGSDDSGNSDQTRDEEMFTEETPWALQLGAGVERQINKRTTFDLDYRYTSAPVELDLDTLRQTNCDGHRISAGFKILF